MGLVVNRPVDIRRQNWKGGDAPVRGPHVTVDLRAWQNVPLDEGKERFCRFVADVDEERLLRRISTVFFTMISLLQK